jgi:hypothetical protein
MICEFYDRQVYDVLPDSSTSASIADSVVPSALANLSAWPMEGVLSTLPTAPM